MTTLKALLCIIIFITQVFLSAEVQAEETTSAKQHKIPSVLLICDQQHKQAWQRFAAWKTQQGKPCSIMSVQEIATQIADGDIQEKIKAFIAQRVKDHSCKWVILGGDAQPNGGLVPDRDTNHLLYNAKLYRAIPTDCYYVSNKSWNANDDAHYGFWFHDKEDISYTGDAVIGRIPIRTKQDIEHYTQKVIEYESMYPTDTYAQSFIYTCTVPFADYKADMYWDQILSQKWKGTCDKFFCGKSAWDKEQDGDYDISRQHFLDRINAKTHGKMHQHGHGLLPLWVLENEEVIDVAAVKELNNSKAYPIITTVSCFTGNFEHEKDPCITESMLRAKQSGAIAIIAPAREGVPIFPNWERDPKDGKTQDGTTRLLTHFWLYGLTEHLTLGEAFAKAKQQMFADAQAHPGYHWCCSEINLLGDPTLDIRALAPQKYSMRVDKQTVAAQKNTVITCSIDKNITGLTVCLWKQDDAFYKVLPFAEGQKMSLDIPKLSSGKLLLTVYGANQNTQVQEISIQ